MDVAVDETDLLEELRKLPMRQSTISLVLAALDAPESSAAQIATALEVDPSLCARVLHLANSPYFGVSGKVGSVERAVVVLGSSVIRSLAVTTAAGLFKESGIEMLDGFWEHSVAVAAVAAAIGPTLLVASGDALCAGLLHDLGAALLFRLRADRYCSLLVISPDEMIVAERAAFGYDHAELGALALDAWM